ncbi:GNAT family N-acetyltransferase [Streptomyces griseorubiginosus]|uniref:GNAT family N-acetyltransferase n=1 Tax=Streptomyces griseorubiginosus TaxID=67304 RepID=UPI001AD7CB63|nr:GNAT family protein [Streptomyces griseorubiginosus]MBO4258590.1 hypothetical protein [Streptomyces griseorubiginosus]
MLETDDAEHLQRWRPDPVAAHEIGLRPRSLYRLRERVALVDPAFGELPPHRLHAVTHTENGAALAVLARSGFAREDLRRSVCFHRGRRHDVAVPSLRRPAWEALERPRAWDL